MVENLTAIQARRVLLAAQGFGRPTATASKPAGTRQFTLLFDRIRLLQLDAVNVFERSHYQPVFARLGHYDKASLDALTFGNKGRYIEYWAHEAALIPLESWPLWRWKMEFLSQRDPARHEWAESNWALLSWLREELASTGPITAREIEHDSNHRTGPWWGWSDVKRGLEMLFRWGEVVSAGRTRFERRYALTEQTIPDHIRQRQVSRSDAHRQLVAEAAQALGVGTAADLADYFRLKSIDVRAAIAQLADSGELVPVAVQGWNQPAWLHRDARIPRSISQVALLSPFDPVVWDRNRAQRMFGFHYRIEIYTPAPQRRFGYYSLPILVDDALVGRIDLKTDRQAGVLRVQSAWHEEGIPTSEAFDGLGGLGGLGGLAERIVPTLASIAAWQGMEQISVTGRGTLSPAIAAALLT
ncbi:MAG: winged helix-turn-helix domain-containing protein [Rhodoglobus sp.]